MRLGRLAGGHRMERDEIYVRCYAHRDDDGSWFAICLDLNLYSRGDTYREARDKLEGIMQQYVDEAFSADREHIRDLIPRRAPLRYWLLYAYAALRNGFSKRDDDQSNRETRRFDERVLPHCA
jgi:predicted RNase H-like HicB family nuclease